MKGIILKSKCVKVIRIPTKCSECDTPSCKPVHKYINTNFGTVYLCERCNIRLKESYFPLEKNENEDFIDGKFIRSGGRWESNKRKH